MSTNTSHTPLYRGRHNRPKPSMEPFVAPLSEPEIDERFKALYLQALGEVVGLTRANGSGAPFDLGMWFVCDCDVESLDRLLHATESERKKAAWLATERHLDTLYGPKG